MGTVISEDLDRLGRVPLFQPLPRETLERVTHGALLQRFPRQTQLFDQGETPDFLHVLLDGSVQMVAEATNGRRTVVEILTPVETFILAETLTGNPYLMSAQVLRPARILMIPAPLLRAQIARDAQLALTLLGSLSAQFRRLVRQIKDLKLRTSTQRLGCYLLQLARASDQHNRVVTLPYDKRLIAARLGMTPESLSRAFAALRPLGVTVQGHAVHLADVADLAAHCKPDQLIDEREPELPIEQD